MPFEHCKVCRKCCHIDEGYPALEIPLLASEKRRWTRLVIESQCTFLGQEGCSLGDNKPFACAQYPLSFDPKQDRYYFDADCPLYEQYQRDLAIDGSDAQNHFLRVKERISNLKKQNSRFLQRNFKLDQAYFDLLDLHVPSKLT
ncbi:MAG: YkgJ family cysteine cluster protein [Betaproteobacteria bacterium]